MTEIDPRIARRRAELRESTATGQLRRVLMALAVVAVAVLAVWVAQLPPFAADRVDVAGAERADVDAVVSPVLGDPMAFLVPRRAGLEEALEAQPWVVEATVSLRFPDTIAVEVVERRPVLTVLSAGRAMVVADDGVVVAEVADPGLPAVELAGVAPTPPGETAADARAVGLAAFVGGLDPSLVADGTLEEVDGELWFRIGGVDVRLGRAVDMAAKAVALEALWAEDLPSGATVQLVSARRPAVQLPADAPVAEADDGAAEPGPAP